MKGKLYSKFEEMETGVSEVQGQIGPHGEIEANVHYLRLCLNNRNKSLILLEYYLCDLNA